MNRRPRSPYFWEEAPFLRPCLALVAGIILYECLRPAGEARAWLLLLPVLILCTVLAVGLQRAPSRAALMLQRILLPLFFAAVGMLAYAVRDLRLRPGFVQAPPQGPTLAVVSGAPRSFGTGCSFPVRIIARCGERNPQPVGAGGRVVCYRDSTAVPALLEGDTILLRGYWDVFGAPANPHEPDLRAAMRRKGLWFRMQTGASGLQLLGRMPRSARSWLRLLHDDCAQRLAAHIHDRQALGLIQAMLLGDEAGFDPLLRGLYADTGIIHIVSISGSHVAMLFALIAALLRWIPGARGAWIRYGSGLVVVWIYVLVAGAPPSALRSAVMFSVVALSTLSRREGRGLNTLCSAAFILLVAEPAWLFAPGFQLSFAAVLSLLLFYAPMTRLLRVRQRALRWLWQAVCASVAAEILTAPIVIWYFHSFPPMFIPANILAGVVIGGAGLAGGLLVILCSPLPALAGAIGSALGIMLHHTNAALGHLQRLSPEACRHLFLTTPMLLLLAAAISCFGIAWLRAIRAAVPAALGCCVLLAGISVSRSAATLGQHRLIVYSNGRQALIDEFRGAGYRPVVSAASDYHAAAARTALGAWRKLGEGNEGALFLAGGRRILVYSDSSRVIPAGSLPVEVLIVTQAARQLRVSEALRCFRPKVVVLASRFSAYRHRLWADSCRSHGVALHDVSREGAWQLQD